MRFLRLVMVLALSTPCAAAAQNELGVSLGGGFSFPVGEVANDFGNGLNFALRTFFPISPRLSVQASIGYQDVRLRHQAEAERRGHNWEEFRLGGGFIEGGNRKALGVLGHGQLYLLPRTGRVAPYFTAGLGASQVRAPATRVYFLGRWDDEVGSDQLALATDVGGGVQVRLARAASLLAQASYLNLFTDNGSTTMVPVYLGLLVELGSR